MRSELLAHWGVDDASTLVPQLDAMNSRVWVVERRTGERLIAKAVPQGDRLASGLEVAQRVQAAGINTGAPRRAANDQLTVPVDGWDLALLEFVPGRPLDTARESDAKLCGTTLGELHHVLVELAVPADTDRWPWTWPGSSDQHLADIPEARAAVGAAVQAARETTARHRLTLGMLHADPDPGSFRADDAGTVGVIDWGQAVWGPLLYDVGSAVVLQRLGGQDAHVEDFLKSYEAAAPLRTDELRLVDVFVRLRWAVQAWWFAWRLAHDNRLGLQTPAGNRAGLNAALQALR